LQKIILEPLHGKHCIESKYKVNMGDLGVSVKVIIITNP